MLRLFLLSIFNIGIGFGVGAVLGKRYRKVTARRTMATYSVSLPPAAADPPPGPGPRASTPAAPTVSASSASAAPKPASAAPRVPAGPLPKSAGHITVDELHDRVASFGAKLTEADEQLRECAATPDLGTIESVLSSIENTARNYAESRETAQQQLVELTRDEDAWESINNELAVAAQIQDVEIEATCKEIVGFNYEDDLAGGCQKIMGHTHRLLNSNDMLRDALQKALADVAQQESCPPEPSDRSDPLTGCVNRAGIEADLNTWWTSVADHTHLCVAMIDIDRLAEANEQFGYRAGNEILKAIAQLLEANRSNNVRVARFSGQRFLLMFSDVDTASATSTVEHCRQTIDAAHFKHKDFDIRITVSCAVTRANNDDSPSSVLLRVESALREAKRFGDNRTFVQEGKYPAPVMPPKLSIETQHITI
jgi:diguanylate cyclase (GGDEF)-like protein